MKIKKILPILMVFNLVGCSSTTEDQTYVQRPNISVFENDNNTVKDSEEQALLNQIALKNREEQSNTESESNSYNSMEHIGELNIKNETEQQESSEEGSSEQSEDSSEQTESTEQPTEEIPDESDESTGQPEEDSDNVSEVEEPTTNSDIQYQIVGGNIVYDDITYTDLYTNIQTIESQSQYDADTLIKFILQCYVSDTDVYTFLNTNSSVEVLEGEDNTNRTVDEILSSESDVYNSICNKYGERATWMITINKWMGKDKAMIAGCKSFTIIIGTDEDIEVDVTNFK